jgi:putative ABC transport system substrate-binding protein
VQNPTKFEFTVNLKTAREFGVTVHPGLIAVANDVIE